jgi:hypothetical protein
MTLEQALLNQAAEECCEIGQRCSKAMRFGTEEVQSGQDLTNGERVTYEFGDLWVVMAVLNELGLVPDIKPELQKRKIDKILKYLNKSIDEDQVDPSRGFISLEQVEAALETVKKEIELELA